MRRNRWNFGEDYFLYWTLDKVFQSGYKISFIENVSRENQQ